MKITFQLTVVAVALLTASCASTSPRVEDEGDRGPDPRVEEGQQSMPAATLGRIENLIGSIADRMDQLEKRQDWMEDANRKSLSLQGLVAESRHYERILATITRSVEPNLSQLACVKSLDNLRQSTAKADRLLEEEDDLNALAQVELELEGRLLESKGCVVNYGEVAYVYFRRDHQGRKIDGRTVPAGLNPTFSEENDRVMEKILASCSKSGAIHLYGYSCDLGSESYDEALAHERAMNLKTYIEGMIKSSCAEPDIRLEAHLGGIIELIDPQGRDEDLLEYQRERNRVVALFLFNQ